MIARRGEAGFGLIEFMVVTLTVALAVGLFLTICSQYAPATDEPSLAAVPAGAAVSADPTVAVSAASSAATEPCTACGFLAVI
jgi:hypothetical protein